MGICETGIWHDLWWIKEITFIKQSSNDIHYIDEQILVFNLRKAVLHFKEKLYTTTENVVWFLAFLNTEGDMIIYLIVRKDGDIPIHVVSKYCK